VRTPRPLSSNFKAVIDGRPSPRQRGFDPRSHAANIHRRVRVTIWRGGMPTQLLASQSGTELILCDEAADVPRMFVLRIRAMARAALIEKE